MHDSENTVFAVEIEQGPWNARELWRATLRREAGVVEVTRWREGSWLVFDGKWTEKNRVVCADVVEEVLSELTGALRKCMKGELPNLHAHTMAMPV